jgi:transcription elongation factor/antiterminator RfaH
MDNDACSSVWYVIHTKPHKESQLNTYLQSQGITTFFPTLRVNPVNPRASKIRPFFPRYLFTYVNLDVVGLTTLNWAPGATRLVMFGGYPATVPGHVITHLKQRLQEIEAAGGLNPDEFTRGDRVRITSGPLAGYEAIFDLRLNGTDRVQVLLDMLGRLVQIKLDANVIEKQRTR